MANAINANPGQTGLMNAAAIATQAPSFYNVTLKNLVIPWTNRDQTVFAPLNDYAATVIGMVRDNVPFNTALSADLLYTGQRRRGCRRLPTPTTTTTPRPKPTASI